MLEQSLEIISKEHLADLQTFFVETIPHCVLIMPNTEQLLSQQTFEGLEDVLEDVKSFRWRHVEDVFKTCLEDILKTSWKMKNCYAEDVFQTSWRHALKTSWRHYWYKQNTFWGYLYRGNLNVYLTNLYFTNLYLTILRWIQNTLIRTMPSIFETQAGSLF